MGQTKILLADDHELVRDGIIALLENEENLTVVNEAANGKEALEIIEKDTPDLLIVDIRMPELNGIEVVKKVKKDFPNLKTLVLSMHDSTEYVVQCVEAGADGYLLKGSSKEEFLKAINKIAGGGKYFSGDISAIIVSNFVNGNSEKRVDTNSQKQDAALNILTKREKQILELILEGKNNQEIGDELKISKRTAEAHRFNLMKKLEVKNLMELTHKSRELKLI
ncbi:two component transcriptional regulator, LuxR family [Salegentibacter salinarum]|nr:response regulator transcription factor [Salegentibacter salinarum]SKB91005.1 two component transcriptional regulator, LuxR family [Salegentibacter salinarum]